MPILTTPARFAGLEILSDSAVLTSQSGGLLPAIYPGQPFSLRWQYWNLVNEVRRRDDVAATIFPAVGLTPVYNSQPQPYIPGGVSEQVDGLVPTVGSVYRLGQPNTLVVRVGAPTVPGSLIEATADYAVIGEELWQGLSWEIHGTGKGVRSTTFAWKESYPVAARFTNISSLITLDGTGTLFESEGQSGLWKPIGTTPINLGPKGSGPLAYPPITHDWGWLVPWVWIINGDLIRTFHYTIEFALTDEYGNTYNFRTPGTFARIAVSDRKVGLAVAALAANVIALILYALAWLITVNPGSVAKSVADGLGKAALDPPTPSRAYRVPVRVPRSKSFNMGQDPRSAPLAEVLSLAQRFGAIDRGLYEIESRILGAIQARDRQALKMQVRSYDAWARSSVETAAKASEAIDRAIVVMRESGSLDGEAARKRLLKWRRYGMRRDLRETGNGRYLSKTAVSRLEACVASPQLMSAAMEGIEPNLLRLRTALLQAAIATFPDRHRITQARLSPGRKASTA